MLVLASESDVLTPAGLARESAFLRRHAQLCTADTVGHTLAGDPDARRLTDEFLAQGTLVLPEGCPPL